MSNLRRLLAQSLAEPESESEAEVEMVHMSNASKDELLEMAAAYDLKVDKRWGRKRLIAAIEEAVSVAPSRPLEEVVNAGT